MSHSFSATSIKKMEHHLDANIRILRSRIAEYAETGETFDLAKCLHHYMVDVLGQLAFSHNFEVQTSRDESSVPPVAAHGLIAVASGSWPFILPYVRKWLPKIPHPGLQALFKGRADCFKLATSCVQRRFDQVKRGEKEWDEGSDILTNLILAKHPDTGAHIARVDVEAESFGFIIAGTHTTSASETLLFYNLLHHPEIMQKCVEEIDQKMPSLSAERDAYTWAEAEALLSYVKKCIKENFRATPVFTLPLERTVADPEGVTIAGRHIKQGMTLAVCNHAFHHNPRVWGDDHDIFQPERWDDPETADRSRYLMHFGLGGRQCLGKTVAHANIYKLTATLLREFDFQIANPEERGKAAAGAFLGKLPNLRSKGVSELNEPLLVVARMREDKP
ncbi:hypothetical protein N0V84_007723 [Fusarium piperis]|uniref:Uncharacterized protein n=1 Tax=Fusarium piperis TaxID=1435070 RepID=A0A9W9BLS0_9HYPO|nr:hypothetical protein N0V84_007723 [Fusarium piperis]